jgi:DNA polymerase-3 subunit alpha
LKKPNKFVGLHSHTGVGSVFDGLGYPQEHIDFCIENGLNAWALTEHGNANSFAHAYLYNQKLKSKGIDFKFIPGAELYVHPDLDVWQYDYQISKAAKSGDKEALAKLRAEREKIATHIDVVTDSDDEITDIQASSDEASLTVENEEETKSGKFFDPVKRRHHLVVLPKTSVGLQRLFSLISRGYLEGFYRFPRVDYKMLKEAADGGHLMVSSACLGGPLSAEVFKHLQQVEFNDLNHKLLDDPSLAKKVMMGIGNTYEQLVDAVGAENVFLELQFNKLSAQHLVNRALMQFANQENLSDKLVVTCDSHYARPEHWKEREIYKKLGWLNHKEFDPSQIPQSREELKCELYPKNADQVWQSYLETADGMSFYDDAIVSAAIERTHDIAHNFIGEISPDTSMKLPSYVIPEGKTADKALVDMCKKALVEKGLHTNKEYVERTIHELKVIKEKKFSEYFLTMKKIIDVAWESFIVGCGRGSGAGSLVNYLLGITNVDPIEYGLLFERFLDPMRTESPDIDTDVSDRDGLIHKLRQEFGGDNVIPISNYNTFKLKSLIKDVARFYGIPFQDVNAALSTLEKDVMNGRRASGEEGGFDITLDEALRFSKKTSTFLESHPEIVAPLNVLFKQNKNLGRHAGGVIISENIADRMPLILAKGEPQTPWVEGMTAKHLESFGWIKFDLLGLETLRMIQKTIELILKKEGNPNPTFAEVKQWYLEHMDPKVMDLKDQKVYEHVYHDGRWAGVFQCTQAGAQKLFKRAKPESIMDLATLTSIYRPGPLSAKVDNIYVRAKKNPESVDYGHPLIRQVLEPSYGCIVFQEQAMALCHVVAGIPKIELNKIRKMMKPGGSSGDNVEKAKALRDRFITGAISNGVKKSVAEDLYEKILFFAGYGFNASHAVCYAINSYYCAWLLTYYKTEWLTAYLEASSSKPEKLAKALSEVKSLGYKVSRADVNYSEREWTCINEETFVPSFASCKGLGDAAIDEIMSARPYDKLEDVFWNEDGSWKPSKLNKTGISALIKLRAFESVDVLEKFDNYRQFHDVVLENWSDIKKSLKKDPKKGINRFNELALETEGTPDWSLSEIINNSMSLLGTVNLESLMPEDLQEKLAARNIRCIDDFNREEIYWALLIKADKKMTKKKKPYLLLHLMGKSGSRQRVFCWNSPIDAELKPNSLVALQLSKTDFGFSTRWRKIVELRAN